MKVLPDGKYHLSGEMAAELKEKHIWAILIGNDTLHVEWRTDNVPDVIPEDYRLSDIAVLSVGYLKDYPTYVGDTDKWHCGAGISKGQLLETYQGQLGLQPDFWFALYYFENTVDESCADTCHLYAGQCKASEICKADD